MKLMLPCSIYSHCGHHRCVHLSQVYRHVAFGRDEMGVATDIRLVEAFLGFEFTVNFSASELESKILN